MKISKNIILLISLLLIYLICKGALQLLQALHPYAGFGFLILIMAFFGCFAAAPIFHVLTLPVSPGPVKGAKETKYLTVLRSRL